MDPMLPAFQPAKCCITTTYFYGDKKLQLHFSISASAVFLFSFNHISILTHVSSPLEFALLFLWQKSKLGFWLVGTEKATHDWLMVAGGVQQEEACRSPGSVTVQRVGSPPLAGSHLRLKQSTRAGGPGSTGSPTALVSTDNSFEGLALGIVWARTYSNCTVLPGWSSIMNDLLELVLAILASS